MELVKRGYDIIKRRKTDRLSSYRVEEAIHPEKISVQSTMTLNEAYLLFEEKRRMVCNGT